MDHNDFILHDAHKRKESLEQKDEVVSRGKKRKDRIQTDETVTVGVRRSARNQGIKVDTSSDTVDLISRFHDEDEPDNKPARALKDLSASQSAHDSAEEEHLRWAG